MIGADVMLTRRTVPLLLPFFMTAQLLWAEPPAPSQPSSRYLEEYLEYRRALPALQESWVEVLKPGINRSLTPPAAGEDAQSPGLSLVASRVFVRLGLVDAASDVPAMVESNAKVIKRLRALSAPHGPLPLSRDDSLVDLASSPDVTTMRVFGALLLADAAISTDRASTEADLRAVDHVLRIQASGHSSLELGSAMALERMKWEYLLAEWASESARDRYARYMRSSGPVVVRRDLAATLREYQRRWVLWGLTNEPAFWLGKEPIDEAGLSEVDRAFEDLAARVLTIRDPDELYAFVASLEAGHAAREVMQYELKEGAGRTITLWFLGADLSEMTKMLYAGKRESIPDVEFSVIKAKRKKGGCAVIEATFENRKWLIPAD